MLFRVVVVALCRKWLAILHTALLKQFSSLFIGGIVGQWPASLRKVAFHNGEGPIRKASKFRLSPFEPGPLEDAGVGKKASLV